MKWEKLLRNKPTESPSVSFCQSLLTSFSSEFLFTVKYCTADFLVRYSQAPFSASFSSSPAALNSFLGSQALLWQYWVLGLWARQVSLSDGSPSPRSYCTPAWISGCSSGLILSPQTVDIGFSPSNSTSHIWNVTVNCLGGCMCVYMCLFA